MSVHQISFSPGCPIRSAAEQLVAAANEHGMAEGKFNGIRLAADKAATAEAIVADYDAQQKAAAEAYCESPEGKAAALAADERRATLQQRHDILVRRLPKLDFEDQVAVLDWLCEMQEPSDHVGVITRRDTIIATFEHHGFKPDVNCGADFRKGDRDNEFRWLVGQALSTLEAVAIHGLIHKFAAEWKATHVREVAS